MKDKINNVNFIELTKKENLKLNKKKSKHFKKFILGMEVATVISSFFAHNALIRYGLFRGQDEFVYWIGKKFGDSAFRSASIITNAMIISPKLFALGVGTVFLTVDMLYLLLNQGFKLIKKTNSKSGNEKVKKY